MGITRINQRTGKRQVQGFYVKSINTDFYKLFWLLFSLTMIGITIWLGTKLSNEHPFTILYFIVALIFLVLSIRQSYKNRWRSSSYKRYIVGLVAIFPSFFSLLGTLYLLFPSLALKILDLLPTSISETLVGDMIYRMFTLGTTVGFFIPLIIMFVLSIWLWNTFKNMK